jgi:hypothetical protein
MRQRPRLNSKCARYVRTMGIGQKAVLSTFPESTFSHSLDPKPPSAVLRFRNAPTPSSRTKALAVKNMRGLHSPILRLSKTEPICERRAPASRRHDPPSRNRAGSSGGRYLALLSTCSPLPPWPVSGMRIYSSSPFLRCAFYGEGAEFRILVANLTSLFVLGSVAPRLRLLKAVP